MEKREEVKRRFLAGERIALDEFIMAFGYESEDGGIEIILPGEELEQAEAEEQAEG